MSTLPFWNTPNERFVRGSLNFAETEIGSGGVDASCLGVLDALDERLHRDPPARSVASALTNLSPRHAASAVRDRVSGIPELAPPGTDPAALRARRDTLASLAAGHEPSIRRKATAAAEEVAAAGMAILRAFLEQAFGTQPRRIAEVVAQVRTHRASEAECAVDRDALRRFGRLVQCLGELTDRRDALPDRTWRNAVAKLSARARDAYEEALTAFAAEAALEVLGNHLPKIEKALAEAARHGTAFQERIEGVRTALRGPAIPDGIAPPTPPTTVLLLDGATEGEVMATLRQRLGAADPDALGEKVRAVLEPQLRARADRAQPALPPGASLPMVLIGLDAACIAAELRALVEDATREGFGLYDLVDRHGVDAAARFLWTRSGPTCHLGGRAIEAFGVTPTEVAILRLPTPANDRERAIAERLANSFRGHGSCEVRYSDGARSVSALRVLAGFPIGIEEQNRALLERYARAKELGHKPHLAGLVPDSPNGEASPAILRLREQIRALRKTR